MNVCTRTLKMENQPLTHEPLFKEILSSRSAMAGILNMFDNMPNIYFYIKDVHRRFFWMNVSLRRLLGEKEETGFLGKTDSDYFSPDLVFLYRREDDGVIATRSPVLNQPWFVPGCNDKQKWFLSSKIPLMDDHGNALAIAGLMRNLEHEYESMNPMNEMKSVIDYIFIHYHEKISVDTLASLVFLSPRQFERRFHDLFHVSPSDFILKIRIDTAIRLLIESKDSITKIAQHCGFYDNSYFTRQFRKMMNLSPLQFRQKYVPCPPQSDKMSE